MKRGRKDSKTPVQKTTILNFFQRTPATSRSLADGPSQSSPTPSTSQRSTSPVETKLPSQLQECPACGKMVLKFNMNYHLDLDCPSSETAPEDDRVKICSVDKPECVEADKRTLDHNFTSLKEFPKLTQVPVQPCTPSKSTSSSLSFSTSKKYSSRKRELAKEFQLSQASNEPEARSRKRHSSQPSGFRKKLFVEEENQSPPRPRLMPYYLENFLFCINSTCREPLYSHLFDEGDRKWYETFKALSLDAKKLYVRLFTRKHHWRRSQKIEYKDEIGPDLKSVLSELCSCSLLLDMSHVDDLQTLLKLLFQPELKQICKDMKLPFNSKGNACQDLMNHCKKQSCLVSGGRSMTQVIEAKAKTLIQSCFKLNEEPRRVFLRFYMLSSLHQRQEEDDDKGQQQQMFTSLLVNIGRASFPSYRIVRQRLIFKNRDHFIRYEEAVNLEVQVRDLTDRGQFEEVVHLTSQVGHNLEECLSDSEHDVALPSFLRRFTAGSVLIYCCNKRIDALQRLKRHQEAVSLLSTLVRQNVYLLTHRGHWYERLALNVEQHLKNPQQALELISDGLKDPSVTPSHKLALSQRASRICQSAKSKDKLSSLLNHLPLLTAAEPRSVTIVGRHLPRDLPGHKSTFIRGDSQATLNDGEVTLCSVEELVLQHYKENGYSHGLHSEGSVITTLLGLLFWDVIYETEVADAFLSPFQSLPLDFTTADFYESRRMIIDSRLESIRKWSSEAVVQHVSNVWHANRGRMSLISWDRFGDIELIAGLLHCIPPPILAAICHRLLQNYRHFRSGFPDLTVWNPREKKWKIVEVKGPNDRLSTKQILWLDFLVVNGIDAEVCHVEAVGAKRMGATVQASRPQVPTKSKWAKKVKQVEGEDDFEVNEAEAAVCRSKRKRLKLNN